MQAQTGNWKHQVNSKIKRVTQHRAATVRTAFNLMVWSVAGMFTPTQHSVSAWSLCGKVWKEEKLDNAGGREKGGAERKHAESRKEESDAKCCKIKDIFKKT